MADSHVFVTLGDLTHLRCDAWLLPADSRYEVEGSWTDAVEGLAEAIEDKRDRTSPFGRGEVLAEPLDWDNCSPLPVLTAVPLHGVHDAEDVRAPVEEFIAIAASKIHARPSRVRSVPLLGMPLFGTRRGGAQGWRGAVLRELLTAARDAAALVGVDVALILKKNSDLALAQSHRRQEQSHGAWPALSADLFAEAQDLGGQASQGKLVPFLGSGVSATAGAPTWKKLIQDLVAQLNLEPEQFAQLGEMDTLDQAHIVQELFREKGRDFGKQVAEAVDVEKYGLAPALLASLPVNQVVTLNYDRLFEIASQDADKPVTVLPDAQAVTGQRWLLKLHGTVSDPSSIVLTREDYLGYATSRGALSAIVKALLFTHHLLFVGFGFADDHVHEIIHDVRRAMPETGPERPFGTALSLDHDPLQKLIWKGRVEVLPMQDANADRCDPVPGREARALEIFLDCLLAYAANGQSFLLADGYKEVLSLAEAQLRERLMQLDSSVSAAERNTPGWTVIEGALRELGLPAS